MKKGDLVKVMSGNYENFIGYVEIIQGSKLLIKDDLGNKIIVSKNNVEVL